MINEVALAILGQALLVFGLAGLFWPDKLMPLFGTLMFPWRANHRMIQAHGIATIAAYVFLVAILLVPRIL
jgi:hypothetical protein